MLRFISQVSIAEAATIINVIVAAIQHSFSLSTVILLIFIIPKVNSPIAWNSITRTLHTSLWSSIFRLDTSDKEVVCSGAPFIAHLLTTSTILILISGVILPLGLRTGPLVPSTYQVMGATYVADTSAMGLATTPDRGEFHHGRVCGFKEPMTCPGHNDVQSVKAYPSSIIEVFNSTPHSPFSMQFRRFFNVGEGDIISNGSLTTSQSLLLRDDAFIIEGLIVDMSISRPGIGFWNQTIPDLPNGGTWDQEILWLEPVTGCVDTGLTIDYMANGPEPDPELTIYNLTDHGGFFHLKNSAPPRLPLNLNRHDDQYVLSQNAWMGAFYSNLYAMQFLNITHESSRNGSQYPIRPSTTSIPRPSNADIFYNNVIKEGSFNIDHGHHQSNGTFLSTLIIGRMASVPLGYLSSSATSMSQLRVFCEGFGGADIVSVSKPYIACGIFLGTPRRSDGGDARIFESNSGMTQAMYACASTTRASIRRVSFFTNKTSLLQDIQVSAQPNQDPSVLWAIERSNMSIQDVELMWGVVDDKFQNDSRVWTIRNNYFYLPPGASSVHGYSLNPGQPLTAHSTAWEIIYNVGNDMPKYSRLMDYTGGSDYGVQNKFEALINKYWETGPANIRNAIWTDIMANTVIGTYASNTLLVAPYQKSIEYDPRFAIPGIVLVLLWFPVFLAAIFLLISREVTFEYMRQVLCHTSVGWVVIGDPSFCGPDQRTGEQDSAGAAKSELEGPEKASHSLAKVPKINATSRCGSGNDDPLKRLFI